MNTRSTIVRTLWILLSVQNAVSNSVAKLSCCRKSKLQPETSTEACAPSKDSVHLVRSTVRYVANKRDARLGLSCLKFACRQARILRTGDPSSNSTPDQLTGLHKDPALHFASAAEHNQGLAGTLRDRDHTGLGADMGLDRRGTVPVADCSIPSADPAGSILVAAPAADSSSVAARKVHREDNSPAAGPGRMDQAIRFRRSA